MYKGAQEDKHVFKQALIWYGRPIFNSLIKDAQTLLKAYPPGKVRPVYGILNQC